ncbi:S-glutathione dehydrogenase [Plectosphaerella cucumerina]|uniref:S-glutathione dehydrogenase n=1 Tax=Plectosphaerella cucumerina TaxID=40658 RepID=A0A8K0TN17_9PEZI|nr:S-glutathione dehydrogenase [Plectosphaerella cucumerina]
MTLPKTMKAVVYDGLKTVSVVDKPVPAIQDPRDIIVRVEAAAVCGSDLHVYRGIEPCTPGVTMGHEFSGFVVEKGDAVKTVSIGDRIVSPFTTSCMDCFYCRDGYSSRCEHSLLFGCEKLDGAQAEYVRVPFADGTVLRAPETLATDAALLMGDIWPTGFFGASNARQMLGPERWADAVVVVVGLGPVGLCAVITALGFAPRKVFAIDGIESRLKLAADLGAEPLNFNNGTPVMLERIHAETNGRGADAVIEVVGLLPAMKTAYEVVRPWGVISSVGVHNTELPFTGADAYDKNLRIQMGRCPVRSIFSDALAMLEKKQHLLSFMFDKIISIDEAPEGYKLFDAMKVQKVILKP